VNESMSESALMRVLKWGMYLSVFIPGDCATAYTTKCGAKYAFTCLSAGRRIAWQ
jgi:hypothetical protein